MQDKGTNGECELYYANSNFRQINANYKQKISSLKFLTQKVSLKQGSHEIFSTKLTWNGKKEVRKKRKNETKESALQWHS